MIMVWHILIMLLKINCGMHVYNKVEICRLLYSNITIIYLPGYA